MTQLVDEGFEIETQVYVEKITSLLFPGGQHVCPLETEFLAGLTLRERDIDQ